VGVAFSKMLPAKTGVDEHTIKPNRGNSVILRLFIE
jgi:hypothetical protein